MFDVFSEIDLSDNATPVESNESPATLRARRKNFSSSHKHISSSSPPTNQINSALHLNTSFHELTSPPPPPPPPPLSLLDSSSSLSSSYSTNSTSTRYPPSSSSSSSPPPPPFSTTISSDSSLSPKNLSRSGGSIDLTKRTFNFPLSRQDSIIESLLSAIYERDGSIYGLSSSQDSDTVTTGDFTDQSHPRRLSGDSILNHGNTIFSKSNLNNKSKFSFFSLCYFEMNIFCMIRYTRITTFVYSNSTTDRPRECSTC
jgi:hypothetical protein